MRTPSKFPALDTSLFCKRLCRAFSGEMRRSLQRRECSMFRFTIRDLLWLMVVVALVVGWWVDRRDLNATVSKLKSDSQMKRAVDSADFGLRLR